MSIKLCNPKDAGITMEQITQTINESEDLVIALESVAAMYGVPSTHILSDPGLKSIRVEGDTIIAPPVTNVSGNTKAIMQSIGAVIDYVSQRVDDRLNDFQHDCIKHNKLKEHVSREANPAKGKVVARHVDEDGNEIFVYDSGLIDSPPTKAAKKLVDELRKNGMIPACKDKVDDCETTPYSYFTPDDDITIGTSLHESANPISENFKNFETPLTQELKSEGEELPEPETVDIGGDAEADKTDLEEVVKESYETLSLISAYGNTRNLGYELMMEYGLDYVKPVIYQEAKEEKKIEPADISYMKFDNSHILKAVKLINEIRATYPTEKRLAKINYSEFINNPKFKQAIDEIASQFDARITFRVLTNTGKTAPNVSTSIYENTVKNKVTISKSKGFQLNGTPIDIMTYNSFIEKNAPDDHTLFGQFFVGIMCHEIFHNISSSLRVLNNSVQACVAAGLEMASATHNPKKKRIILTNMIDTLDSMEGITIPKNKKKKLVADLSVLSIFGKLDKGKNKKASSDDKPEKDEKKADTKPEIKDAKGKTQTLQDKVDKAVKKNKKTANSINLQSSTRGVYTLGTVIGIAMGLIGAAVASPGVSIAGLILGSSGLLANGFRAAKHSSDQKKYKNGEMKQRSGMGAPIKNNEEFYCDLFASMYGLPPTFFVLSGKKNYTANDLREAQLKALYASEKEVANALKSPYPVPLERDYCAVKVARATLANKKDIDPATKKYLEWIIDNYSQVEKIDIDTLYNKSTFDPGSAENLDHHLRKLITDNNITLTEYDLSWLDDMDGYDDEDDDNEFED